MKSLAIAASTPPPPRCHPGVGSSDPTAVEHECMTAKELASWGGFAVLWALVALTAIREAE